MDLFLKVFKIYFIMAIHWFQRIFDQLLICPSTAFLIGPNNGVWAITVSPGFAKMLSAILIAPTVLGTLLSHSRSTVKP